jgi:hypothetical protein
MPSATVYIWASFDERSYQKLGWGHAGLRIITDRGPSYYITWYPRGEGGLLLKVEAHKDIGFARIRNKAGQVVDNPNAHGTTGAITLAEECQINGDGFRSIDVSVRDDATLFGLCMDRMESFWKRVLNLPPGHDMRRFGLISTRSNCAGMVATTLLVGGLGLLAKPPNNSVYQDVRTLSEWVTKAEGRIREMNELHDEFRTAILGNEVMRAKGGPPRERTVPTLEEWKKESDKGIAFYARRKEQVEMIDSAIRRYHRTPLADRWTRLGWMHKILWFVYNHLTRKPNSDRRLAVLRLAVRVHAAVQDLSKEVDQAEIAYPIQHVPSEDSSSDEDFWQQG